MTVEGQMKDFLPVFFIFSCFLFFSLDQVIHMLWNGKNKLNISAPYWRIWLTLQIISPDQNRLSTTFLTESA